MKFLRLLSTILVITVAPNFAQVLLPGDGIKVTFYNISDPIQGDYYIQDNGRLQLPFIGMVNAINKDFAEIRNEIVASYSKIYVHPEVNIQPLYRISILGEVGNPGIYFVNGYETLTDIVALAGGETSDSNIENLVILREDSKVELDLKAFLKGENRIADIGIESGDKIYVPRTWWVGARDASILLSGVTALVAIASLFTR